MSAENETTITYRGFRLTPVKGGVRMKSVMPGGKGRFLDGFSLFDAKRLINTIWTGDPANAD